MIKICKWIRLTTGVALFLITTGVFGQTATINTVFFSEYIQGDGANQAVEIYNGSGSAIALSEFSIAMYERGFGDRVFALSGTLNAGEVYVIGATSSALGISGQADVLEGDLFFYGDTGVALLHNGEIVDFIGNNSGARIGTGWSVAGMANATANHTLVRKQNITQGNPTPEASFGRTVDDSEWIVYDQDEFRYLGSHCTISTQATGVTFGTTDHTSMVVNWTKGAGFQSLVVVKEGSAVDAVLVFGTGYTTATTAFSDGEATLDTDNVVVYSGDMETVTVTGLTQATTYYVAVYAYNATGFCYNFTSPARSSKRTTTPNDEDSDITRVGGETAAIAYVGLQDASLTTANSASLFTFSINDKGMGTEALSTIVTAISFDITNHQYLRTLALFAEGLPIAELDVATNISTNTLSFTELDIEVAPRMTKEVNVRATFVEDVDDGEEIGLTISAVTADVLGSLFAARNGGGAATISSNQIAVIATEFAITAPDLARVNTDFRVAVTAVDVNNNIDLSARDVTLSRATGRGDLTPATELGPVAMRNGVYTWNDLQYNVAEPLTVSVTDGTLSATEDINVWTPLTSVFFSEYIEGSQFGDIALEIYNGSGSDIDDLSEFSISLYWGATVTAGITITLNGTLNAGDVYVISRRNPGSGIRNQVDFRHSNISFSGDDGIALSHNGVIVDIIGNNGGTDPGNGWPVAGTANATQNHTLVRKQSFTQGNAIPLRSFGTTEADSEWIVYDQDEFSYLGSHCTISTQVSGVAFGTTDDTSIVVNWTKGDGFQSLVVVKEGSAVDAVPVFGTGYPLSTTVFSAAVATLDTDNDNVVVYSGELATVRVTGLTPGRTYYVAVYAYNATDFCYNITSPARDSKTTTATNDVDSDITRVGGETAAIAYVGLQDASLTTANSASLFTFSINDKGMGTEALSTIVTAISFEITNHQYLRTLALFDGTADGADLIKELEVASNTVDFTELDIRAASSMTKEVNVRATFLTDVDDGEEIGLTISAVTADVSGSVFAENHGGGATTATDTNAIEVTATTFTIVAPANVPVNTNFTVVVTAVDALGNTDIDAIPNVTLGTTGTDALSSSGGVLTSDLIDGVYT